MHTAQRIVDAVDSIDEYERKHNAAELAIIYETQEKEAKIAEQSKSITRQRIIVAFSVLMLLIVFFIIFSYVRSKATKRLAEMNQQLKQKNEELTIANARAEESSRMKTDFIQQISHEIRTPLNILNGFTQILTTQEVELKKEEKEDIEKRISENTNRITELVNKMLELSEANNQTVIRKEDKKQAIEIAEQACQNSGIYKAIHIQFEMLCPEDSGEAEICTNFRYATRALTLLLDNAQKFTKTGKVKLILQQDTDTVKFIVEDTGIGIPKKEAENIFGEFVQLDEYYDGTGLGLTVARNLARRMGGDIILDTTYTDGARFIMTLPKE